ncbi:MAG: glycosyltransferase family 4 protein [Methylococcales bacterium]
MEEGCATLDISGASASSATAPRFRSLPPTAAPIKLRDQIAALPGLFFLDRAAAVIWSEGKRMPRSNTPPTKVLYVDHTPSHGGSVESLARVAQALDRQKFQPVIVLAHTMEGKSPFADTPIEVVPYRLPLSHVFPVVHRAILRVKDWSRLMAACMSGLSLIADVLVTEIPRLVRLYRIARRHQVGLVHLNNTSYDLAGILTAKLLGVPCVCHHRDFKVVSPLLKWQAQMIDWHIAISEAIRQDVLRLGVKPDQVSIVFDSIDPERHDPDVDISHLIRAFEKQPGEKFFGIFGRVVGWKGQDYFLKAAAIVLEKVPISRAFIVGDDTDGTAGYIHGLHELVEQLGIASRVVFAGFRRDVPMMMKLMDVVVHASIRPEPFGMVVIEAMAMGRPTVATVGGGPSEIIQDGVNGVLVPPQDAQRLAQEICRLLLDERRAGQIGRQAVRRAREFGNDTVARTIENLYDDVFAK